MRPYLVRHGPANAADDVGVIGVEFAERRQPGAEDTTAPLDRLDSATVANGSHVITAVARDGPAIRRLRCRDGHGQQRCSPGLMAERSAVIPDRQRSAVECGDGKRLNYLR